MRRRLGAWVESFGHADTSDAGSRDVPAEEATAEELYVMPGWSVLRPREPGTFDLSVSISGYCSQTRPPSRVTRTQRVMLSLVRRFAALPNLPGIEPEHQPMGPIPTAVGMALLEQAGDEVKEESEKVRKPYQAYQSKRRQPPADGSSPATPVPRSPSRQSTFSSSASIYSFSTREALHTAHENLEKRLAPFLSTILPNRRILFDIYVELASPTPPRTDDSDVEAAPPTPPSDPIYSFELITDENGHFSDTVTVPWSELSKAGLMSESLIGCKLRLRSRLDYEELPIIETEHLYRARVKRAISQYGVDATDQAPSSTSKASPKKVVLNDKKEPQVIKWATIRVGRGDGVHIISDLDDTVKHSDILAGPREVFRNVFCRPLHEICVPEMDALYRRLEEKGVQGFHFVSNSPSQLFPSIHRFLTLNSFPSRHSIKLKYYGGRSIFSSLYDSPAERKRGSLQDLFQAFPRATLVMLGDSAEQDLELYVEFARRYPGRVGAIAIRDVTSGRAADVWKAIEDLEQGIQAQLSISHSASITPSASSTSLADMGTTAETSPTRSSQFLSPNSISPERPRPSRTSSTASVSSEDEMTKLTSSQQKIIQRAATWQTRMDKARAEVPSGTELYFFKDPSEIEPHISDIVARAVTAEAESK